MVRKTASNFQHERNDFGDWLEELSGTAEKLYQILIKETTPISEEQLRSHLSSLANDFVVALDALCYHGLVISDSAGNYRIAGEMFNNWF